MKFFLKKKYFHGNIFQTFFLMNFFFAFNNLFSAKKSFRWNFFVKKFYKLNFFVQYWIFKWVSSKKKKSGNFKNSKNNYIKVFGHFYKKHFYKNKILRRVFFQTNFSKIFQANFYKKKLRAKFLWYTSWKSKFTGKFS